jgi:hypothetical protein
MSDLALYGGLISALICACSTDDPLRTEVSGSLACDCEPDMPCAVDLCPEASLWVPLEGEEPLSASEEDALEVAVDCALAALRDGTPGTIRWDYRLYLGGFGDYGTVQILDDRAAVVTTTYRNGDTPEEPVPTETLVELATADHFEACLSLADVADRLDCIRVDVGDTTTTCE